MQKRTLDWKGKISKTCALQLSCHRVQLEQTSLKQCEFPEWKMQKHSLNRSTVTYLQLSSTQQSLCGLAREYICCTILYLCTILITLTQRNLYHIQHRDHEREALETLTAQTAAALTHVLWPTSRALHMWPHVESLSRSRAFKSQFWHLSEEAGAKVEKEDV